MPKKADTNFIKPRRSYSDVLNKRFNSYRWLLRLEGGKKVLDDQTHARKV